MGDRNRIEVRIAGKDYTLVGVESDEYMQKVALYVNKKISEIMENDNRLSTAMAAVLAAINVGDDYFKVHSNEQNLQEKVEELNKLVSELQERNKYLTDENIKLKNSVTDLQLQLAKREAELKEVRNTVNKKKY